MDFESIIKTKIHLFTKEKFFYDFRNILLDQIVNPIKPYYSLINNISITNTENRKNILNPNNKISGWNKIYKNIFSKTKINAYPNIESLVIGKSYEINSLKYFYLYRLAKVKISYLSKITNKNHSLKNLVQIYLQFCKQEIILYKEMTIPENINQLFKRKFNKYKSLKISVLNSAQKTHRNKKYKLLNDISSMKPQFFSISKNNKLNNELNNKKDVEEENETGNIIINHDNDIHIFKRRNKSAKTKILYCNSFTRLFIGETDENSIKERHLSNIVVKKEQKLNFSGHYVDLSGGYLERLFSRIYKKNKTLTLDKDISNTLKKFEKNQKFLNGVLNNLSKNTKNTVSNKKTKTMNNYTELKKNTEFKLPLTERTKKNKKTISHNSFRVPSGKYKGKKKNPSNLFNFYKNNVEGNIYTVDYMNKEDFFYK